MPNWNVKMVEVERDTSHGFMISVFQFFSRREGLVRSKVFALGFSRGIYPGSSIWQKFPLLTKLRSLTRGTIYYNTRIHVYAYNIYTTILHWFCVYIDYSSIKDISFCSKDIYTQIGWVTSLFWKDRDKNRGWRGEGEGEGKLF